MKNIHILPTDKPSRLLKTAFGLELLPTTSNGWRKPNQNIYITSNEDPKNKDYYWDENKLKVKRYFEDRESFPSLLHRFKVILTTDPKLIADGVQAIDDEFLEWFVKNPSCEFVELEVDLSKHNGQFQTKYGWKIIIPKQESFVGKIIPLQLKYNLDNMKQKTLEEAANNWIKSTSEFLSVKNGFIAGAKLQAERMYSDEEVLEHLNRLIMMPSSKLDEFTDDEEMLTMKWFEQFKKK
jgi:hypothetical protein